MAELPYIMAIFLSAAINNFHIFMAIYCYGHYGVPIPVPIRFIRSLKTSLSNFENVTSEL